jgi:phosphoglycolate phosphatase
MVELVKKCKSNNMFLAIVSSDLPETLLPEVKEWGLEDVFNQVVTNADDKYSAVQELIQNNNLSIEETCFIGDSNHEIDVSKATGIKSMAVTWGFTSEDKLKAKNPDYLAHNVQELEAVIL